MKSSNFSMLDAEAIEVPINLRLPYQTSPNHAIPIRHTSIIYEDNDVC